jgi:hypothetical protein
MPRKLSMLAPEWLDYTTLEDDILNYVAKMEPAQATIYGQRIQQVVRR